MKIKRGSTSVRRLIFIADSSSTVGAGLANLAYNTASLVAYYVAGDLSANVQITLATATLGTWTSGGFVAVNNSTQPGWYEIGIPNAALDGGNECAIQIYGAANMVPVNLYIELDAFDYQTATQPVNVTQFGGNAGTFAAGIPTVELDSVVQAQIDNIEDDTTSALSSLSSLSSAISAVAAIFTGMTSLPNWLRRAWRKDTGTAGMSTAETEINTGGTATFAGTTDSQEAIKDAIGSSGGGPAYSAAVVAARLPVGSAAGWPQEIVCGSAYLTALGTHVPLYVKDVDENILAEMGEKTFVDVDFKAILRLSPLTDANKLLSQPAATIEVDSADTPGIVFNDDTAGEEYFELQIPKAKTALGEIRTRYLCQVILRWGDGSEYEWIVNLGESKFIRGVAAAA